MSDDKVSMTDAEESRLDFIGEHRAMYLRSGGTEGHIVDFREIGGLQFTTTLLLETFGRKSGERRVAPLIYGNYRGQVVVVASKGGADVHPGWYFNLLGTDEVTIQIGTQAFRATWREAQGDEAGKVWEHMEGIYPPYVDYRKATEREIPLVLFTVGEATDVLKA